VQDTAGRRAGRAAGPEGRTLREILGMYQQAGLALAAAHELLHDG